MRCVPLCLLEVTGWGVWPPGAPVDINDGVTFIPRFQRRMLLACCNRLDVRALSSTTQVTFGMPFTRNC